MNKIIRVKITLILIRDISKAMFYNIFDKKSSKNNLIFLELF